jgi:hypothetical protein
VQERSGDEVIRFSKNKKVTVKNDKSNVELDRLCSDKMNGNLIAVGLAFEGASQSPSHFTPPQSKNHVGTFLTPAAMKK